MQYRRSILKGPLTGPFSFFFLGLLAFAPALFSQTLVNPDAQFILERLLKTASFGSYLSDLFSFRTLDVQPFRDMSFMLDLKIYTYFGFNSAVWQNLVWWVVAVITLQKMMNDLYPEEKDAHLYLAMIFCVYPLFSQIVPWGVARKHLMSFTFILLATRVMTQSEQFSNKSKFKITIFYFLSVFSQPISLLWPCWLAAWLKWGKRDRLKENGLWVAVLFIILALTAAINRFYYLYSPTYLASYVVKGNGPFNIGDKILGLGHYTFQLVFPYLLSFQYDLGHWSSLIGLLIVIIASLILYKKKLHLKHALMWCWFALLPLALVLIDPRMLYDTYLLIPAAGMILLLTPYLHSCMRKPRAFAVTMLAIIFLTTFTFDHSKAWTDENLMVEKSFNNQPSCLTASDYLKISYENEKPTPVEAKKFLYEHECEMNYGNRPMTVLYSFMLYHETDQTLDERISQLKQMALTNVFSQMALIAIYINHDMNQAADEELEAFTEKYQNTTFRSEYIPFVARTIYPYCQSKKNVLCLEKTKPLTQKKQQVFYK